MSEMETGHLASSNGSSEVEHDGGGLGLGLLWLRGASSLSVSTQLPSRGSSLPQGHVSWAELQSPAWICVVCRVLDSS